MNTHPPEPTVAETSPLSFDEEIRLHFEVQRLYAVEAQLLDQHRYADWLELFAEDLHYWAPVRTNRLRRQQALADGAPGEVGIFDETKASLAWRIRRFDSGMAWAEDPPSRTRHLITNVLVGPGEEPGEYVAESAFLCYRNRLEREVEPLRRRPYRRTPPHRGGTARDRPPHDPARPERPARQEHQYLPVTGDLS